MANKYPGGYQIIDLGDLSKVTDDESTSLVVPGIYERVTHSSKPIIFTGTGRTSGNSYLGADTLSRCSWMTVDDQPYFGRAIYDADRVLIALSGLRITVDDVVMDYCLEE